METNSKESNQKTDWIFIPGGPAVIGADRPGEGPAQVLHVPGFCIGRTAITNQEFRSFIKDGGYDRAELWDADGWSWVTAGNIHEPAFWRESLFNRPNQPVTGVCFHEAQAYARWVSARLPTEIEWEKAARGTNGALYPGAKSSLTRSTLISLPVSCQFTSLPFRWTSALKATRRTVVGKCQGTSRNGVRIFFMLTHRQTDLRQIYLSCARRAGE